MRVKAPAAPVPAIEGDLDALEADIEQLASTARQAAAGAARGDRKARARLLICVPELAALRARLERMTAEFEGRGDPGAVSAI